MRSYLARVLSVAVGSITVTLLTGLVNSTPSGGFVGASWYGYPVTWIRRLVVAPQYNPWVIDWTGCIADFVFWFIIIFIIGFAITKISESKTHKPSARQKSRRRR